MDTKTAIIQQAIALFNERGYGHVNMHDLAKAMKMSRGNLAYHYKDKRILLEEIVSKMWEGFDADHISTLKFPSFSNIEAQLRTMHKLQKVYSFIFADTHVLTLPFIRQVFKDKAHQSIIDFKTIIAYAIRVENMKAEQIPGTYDSVAYMSWMIGFYWSAQMQLAGRPLEDCIKMIWALLMPHFTDKGLDALSRHCGIEVNCLLGEPFENTSDQLVIF